MNRIVVVTVSTVTVGIYPVKGRIVTRKKEAFAAIAAV